MLTRQREFLQWIIGGLLTAVMIVGGVWFTQENPWASNTVADMTSSPSGSRAPASTSSSVPTKLEILEKHSSPMNGPENKASGSLQLSLTSLDGRRSDGSLVLDASITATADLQDVKYEWVLPDGVSIVSGASRGDLGHLTTGTATSLEVALNVPSNDDHVHLHVYREFGGEKLGQVVQYNTVTQSSINFGLAVQRESIQSEVGRKPASTQTDNRRME